MAPKAAPSPESPPRDYDDVTPSEALVPDPQHENDFLVEDNKFAFSPGQLNKLMSPKSLAAFRALGGLQGLARGLQTDLSAGLSVDEDRLLTCVGFEDAQACALDKLDSRVPLVAPGSGMPDEGDDMALERFSDRRRVFGCNEQMAPRPLGVWRLLWNAYNDKIIILLTIAAVVSLSLGISEAASGQSKVDWVEGVAVCVAILIVVSATAGNDWQKERQFTKLNRRVWCLGSMLICLSTDYLAETGPGSEDSSLGQVANGPYCRYQCRRCGAY